MALIKTEIDGLLKDTSQNAFINTNDAEYKRLLESRKSNKKTQQLQNDIEFLKQEFTDIKSILIDLHSKINGGND
jgi:hypothetical protein